MELVETNLMRLVAIESAGLLNCSNVLIHNNDFLCETIGN